MNYICWNKKLKVLSFLISVPGEPKKVHVEAVNSTTIYVEWRPPKSRERNGIIRGYYVYYVEVGENDDPVVQTERMEDTGDGNRNEAVIVGLKPDTRYHIQVAGYTRKGDGMRSNPKTVTTKGAGWFYENACTTYIGLLTIYDDVWRYTSAYFYYLEELLLTMSRLKHKYDQPSTLNTSALKNQSTKFMFEK